MSDNVPATQEVEPLEARQEIREGVYAIPPADIYEDEHGWMLKLDMPGVKQGDAEVGIEHGTLTITGRVEPEARNAGSEYYREYNLRNYYRQFELNQPVDQDHVTAELKHGVLTVHLPRTGEAKPRRIPVEFR
jgi:HSP20 family protein